MIRRSAIVASELLAPGEGQMFARIELRGNEHRNEM